MTYYVITYKPKEGGQITKCFRNSMEAIKEKREVEKQGITVNYYVQTLA